MSWLTRLLRRGQAPEARGSTQDWVDAVLAAQEAGLLRTSMSTLDEEQVGSTLGSIVKSNGPTFALTLARMQVFSQVSTRQLRLCSHDHIARVPVLPDQ